MNTETKLNVIKDVEESIDKLLNLYDEAVMFKNWNVAVTISDEIRKVLDTLDANEVKIDTNWLQ